MSIMAAIGARWQTHVTVHVLLLVPVQAMTEIGQIAVPLNASLLTNRHAD
jgi:hypothetical protein